MKKINWITNIRAIACILIVLLHVIDGWLRPNGIVLEQYSCRWWLDNVLIQLIVTIGVPIFIMISGALLLNPEKDLTFKKYIKYIVRILLLILIFGLLYSFIEEIVTNKIYDIPKQIGISIMNVFEQKTWNVLWYLYMLVGLYILTPVLKSFVKSTDNKTYIFILICLFICGSIVPTLNYILNTEITNFYLGGLIYIFYYLAGYFIAYRCDKIKNSFVYIMLAVGILGDLALLIFKNSYYENSLYNINTISFVAINSMVIFYLFSKSNKKESKILHPISKYSLGIYLVHTFWLNLLNKGLHIYPDYFAAGLGEIVFWIGAVVLSYISCLILYRIPALNKILK